MTDIRVGYGLIVIYKVHQIACRIMFPNLVLLDRDSLMLKSRKEKTYDVVVFLEGFRRRCRDEPSFDLLEPTYCYDDLALPSA